MNPSRPNSPTNTGPSHPPEHKHITDIYNMIISENYLVKQKYNDLLQKYNDLLAEYKLLYTGVNDTTTSTTVNSENTNHGYIHYLQNREQFADKALPTPINGNPTFIPPVHHNPTMNPHPRPKPPTPPPVLKAAIPKPPIPHPPMPHPRPPIYYPKEFEMMEDKEIEVDEKGRHGGHWGHHWGHGGHHGGWGRYPYYPIYPYPYPYRPPYV